MQTPTLRPPKISNDGGGPLATKNGSIAAALVAAAVAGLLIVFFLSQYRDGVNKEGVPTPVLVAEQLIEQGASGDAAGAQGLFKRTEVPRDQVKAGAVTDAATLRGKVAVGELLPGQQLTAADFKPAGSGVVSKLAADQRAITVSLDSAHSLSGNLRVGDRVDILSGFEIDSAGGNRPVLRMLMQDVLVLGVPKKAAGGGGVGGGANESADITLRVGTSAAPKIAFAADNGKIWLVLRPQNGKKLDRSSLITMQSLLVGTKPVKVPSR